MFFSSIAVGLNENTIVCWSELNTCTPPKKSEPPCLGGSLCCMMARLLTEARIHIRIERQLIKMLDIFQRVERHLRQIHFRIGQRLDLR